MNILGAVNKFPYRGPTRIGRQQTKLSRLCVHASLPLCQLSSAFRSAFETGVSLLIKKTL
jgi:hypothetical protein